MDVCNRGSSCCWHLHLGIDDFARVQFLLGARKELGQLQLKTFVTELIDSFDAKLADQESELCKPISTLQEHVEILWGHLDMPDFECECHIYLVIGAVVDPEASWALSLRPSDPSFSNDVYGCELFTCA